jgi:hypothetical protein
MESWAKPMSEFKFACPVCGQHITADSSASGTRLECPTCFQKIVVPQAPASSESKFILAAAQAGKPRPTAGAPAGDLGPLRKTRDLGPMFAMIGMGVILCAAGAGAFFFRDKLFPGRQRTKQPATATGEVQTAISPRKHSVWTLEPTNAVIPKFIARGRIRGTAFSCERAILVGGNLILRQGSGWPPDLAVSVALFAKLGEELSGKTIEVLPDRLPPIPKITVRWKNDQPKGGSQSYASGYLLRIVFGQAEGGRVKGEIYLALPDNEQTFVAGTFDAEIRKPNAPRAPPPKAQANPPAG